MVKNIDKKTMAGGRALGKSLLRWQPLYQRLIDLHDTFLSQELLFFDHSNMLGHISGTLRFHKSLI